MTNRRDLVDFDPDHFGKQREAPEPLAAFRFAHERNLWNGPETLSGPGSSADQTATLRRELPALLRRLGVRVLLDVPSGEFRWMSQVDLSGVTYLGGDLVPEVVAAAAAAHGAADRTFSVLDLTSSSLPAADLLLCRDCLVHLSARDVARAIVNIRRAPIAYILTTTFTAERVNRPIVTGDWRPVNLEMPPFSFPAPEQLLVEGCTEQDGAFADKSLGLWRIADLPDLEPLAAGPPAHPLTSRSSDR